MRLDGIRIGFFGSFYPLVDRLSTTSTGLVTLFSMSEKIENVIVFSPLSSVTPIGIDTSKVSMIPSWRYDSVISLLKTLSKMIRMKEDVDVYFFNIFLTSFGSSGRANVTGLLLPTLLAKLTGKRVCTYMHNFIETQDIEKLGYERKWLATKIAGMLERLIANNTSLIVPLESQRLALETLFQNKVHSIVIPYVEGLYSFMCNHDVVYNSKNSNCDSLSFLLFGSWGPQKDLEGALTIFRELIAEGKKIQVVIGGGVNSNFPEYDRKIEKIIDDFPFKCVRWIKSVSEESVSELFSCSDVLFLPYHAAGGYSAVMNVGAFYGIKIAAYDIHELRELDSIIGAGCVFVDPSDRNMVKETLIKMAEDPRNARNIDSQILRMNLQKSLVAIDDLIGMMIEDKNPSIQRMNNFQNTHHQ